MHLMMFYQRLQSGEDLPSALFRQILGLLDFSNLKKLKIGCLPPSVLSQTSLMTTLEELGAQEIKEESHESLAA